MNIRLMFVFILLIVVVFVILVFCFVVEKFIFFINWYVQVEYGGFYQVQVIGLY